LSFSYEIELTSFLGCPFEQPYIRPKNLMTEKIKSLNTAKKYLAELESLGLQSKEKIGKEYVWFNTELMDIPASED
jgi:hypothetical protein